MHGVQGSDGQPEQEAESGEHGQLAADRPNAKHNTLSIGFYYAIFLSDPSVRSLGPSDVAPGQLT